MARSPFFFASHMLLPALLMVAKVSGSDGGSASEDSEEKLLSTMIGIQGLIYCRSGHKLIPLEGAVARIGCETVDPYGYEAEAFSILSDATNSRGYFIATLSPYETRNDLRIRECRAYLELSPLRTCNVPTDLNQGISGSLLGSYHFLSEKKMKLFTVGPFEFKPETDD